MEKNFSKKLSNTDVFHDLSFPTGSVHHLPIINGGQEPVEFVATDGSTGIPWNFTCFGRKGKYRKPILRKKGWRPFVRSKNLEVGDKISFYKYVDEATGETRFWVAAKKKVKISFSKSVDEDTGETRSGVAAEKISFSKSVDEATGETRSGVAAEKKVMLFSFSKSVDEATGETRSGVSAEKKVMLFGVTIGYSAGGNN